MKYFELIDQAIPLDKEGIASDPRFTKLWLKLIERMPPDLKVKFNGNNSHPSIDRLCTFCMIYVLANRFSISTEELERELIKDL